MYEDSDAEDMQLDELFRDVEEDTSEPDVTVENNSGSQGGSTERSDSPPSGVSGDTSSALSGVLLPPPSPSQRIWGRKKHKNRRPYSYSNITVSDQGRSQDFRKRGQEINDCAQSARKFFRPEASPTT